MLAVRVSGSLRFPVRQPQTGIVTAAWATSIAKASSGAPIGASADGRTSTVAAIRILFFSSSNAEQSDRAAAVSVAALSLMNSLDCDGESFMVSP